ncbi:MAG: 16S rRNA (uracil(1498)-N(3))-methyltransferase [Propionibacterium sp.]|nr:16S rRNA (uracil(1498)-N(3))-methyltransferase [Propionibacterium sp.]
MTAALFLAEFDDVEVGRQLRVDGDEARHAQVKRIAVGETVLLANGRGLGAEGVVVAIDKGSFEVRVERVLRDAPRRHVTAVQALAKGDRALLAVQMLTEVGASRIVAWQSDRSIVRWTGERGDKALAKWEATARESAKQARRLTVPGVGFATTKQLAETLGEVDTVLVLHEDAEAHIRDVELGTGSVAVVIGPEGGIAPAELAALEAAGATSVRVSEHVLRTSTAGAVALGQLEMR